MADNPTTRLADQARASYQKVDQAQSEKIAARERGIDRFQQGVAQTGQMAQQQGQFNEQMAAQKEESQARLGQQKSQFDAEQQLQRDKMKQDQAQFDAANATEIQKAAAQREIQTGQLDLAEREFQQRQENEQREADFQMSKLRQQADESLAKQHAEREEFLTKRRDYYRGEVSNLRLAKEKLLFSKNDADLNSILTSKALASMQGNASIDTAMKGVSEGMKSGQVNPNDVATLTKAIDDYTVKVMVDQAQELGEWNPPPHMMSNPEVQRFNTLMGEAQRAFNSQFQRQMISALQSGEGDKVAQLRAMHGDPDARDRRLARAASRAMRVWYRTRNVRDAATQAGMEGEMQVENPR